MRVYGLDFRAFDDDRDDNRGFIGVVVTTGTSAVAWSENTG
jgi:hypothetical protein